MSDKLTDWFDSSVKPHYPGVYERDYGRKDNSDLNPQYQYFDGFNWYYGNDTVESAVMLFNMDMSICNCPHAWRGLAENPEGEKHE